MTPSDYEQAGSLFDRIRQLPEQDRTAALESACAGKSALRDYVSRLLKADHEAISGSIPPIGQPVGSPDYPSPGDTVGHYRLCARIGEGGMGIVYEAEDLHLHRRVAVKILPPAAQGAEWVRRFQREARAASHLSHPNIVSVFDADCDRGRWFIATEFIEGPTLRRRLTAGKLEFREALEIAIQCASALDAAHQAGILHRDIKPENIMLRPDGLVKVVDFGLARVSANIGNDSENQTAAGTTLGTPRYMAPEQARGEKPDARCDIFGLGAVLYEMTVGCPAFPGATTADIFAALLTANPTRPSATNSGTPAGLDPIVAKALSKDRTARYSSMQEFAVALRGLRQDMDSGKHVRAWISSRRPPRRTWMALAAGLVAVTGVAMLLATVIHRGGQSDGALMRVDIAAPPAGDRSAFALSPDGRQIAYAAAVGGAPSRLWVRALDSTSPHPLPDTEGARGPFWSPDSKSLGFFAEFKLKRVDLRGGQPQVLAAVPSLAPQGAWGESGTILFSRGVTPLFRVPAAGGPVELATPLAKGQSNQFMPRFLPGGREFLYAINGVDPSIWLGSLDNAPPRRVVSITVGSDSGAEYLSPGWLVRVRQGVLEAQRFDRGVARLQGEAAILEKSMTADASNLSGSFSVSASGTVAWRAGQSARRQLFWFDRTGKNLGAFGDAGDSTWFGPEISPDGKWVASMRGPTGSADVWLQDSVRNTRFTFDPADDRYPIWSPDGAAVVFASNRKGAYDLYQKPVNGSGNEQLLVQSEDFKRPTSWSRDGRFLLYWTARNKGDLMVLPIAATGGDAEPSVFLSTPFDEEQGIFSPDGKWVAYQSDQSGSFEVYIRPFPGPGREWQVSAGGGRSPRWRGDGKELYYLSPDHKLMAAEVTVTGAELRTAKPEVLFQTRVNLAPNRQQYDIATDGRFLILEDLPGDATEPIHLLLNWKGAGH
jgi:predicted Ser/Thr protein kinase